MCNPSKKTIKKIDRMLESRCKEHRTFGNALKMYIFRNPTEIGLDYVTFCGKAGYFIGVHWRNLVSTTSSAFIRRSRCWRLSDAKFVEEALETDLQAQERLWRSYRYVKQVLSCRSEQPGRLQ